MGAAEKTENGKMIIFCHRCEYGSVCLFCNEPFDPTVLDACPARPTDADRAVHSLPGQCSAWIEKLRGCIMGREPLQIRKSCFVGDHELLAMSWGLISVLDSGRGYDSIIRKAEEALDELDLRCRKRALGQATHILGVQLSIELLEEDRFRIYLTGQPAIVNKWNVAKEMA